jgi:hypothetical protein
MPSEVTREVTLAVGNAHARQRGSGHSVVLTTSRGPQTQSWEAVRGRVRTRGQQNGPVAGRM